MNHKLEINIDQIEKDNQEDEQMQEDYDQDEMDEDREEYQEKDHDEDDGKSDQLEINSKQFRFQTNENVETFGEEKNHSVLLRQFVNSSNPKHRRTEQLYKLLETPIEIYNKEDEIPHKNRLQQSSIDEEINRIVNKVMHKKSIIHPSPVPKHFNDLQQVKKIDAINKELLSQNTKLIGQINQLERQLTTLNKRLPVKRKIEQNKNKSLSNCEDKDILKTMRKYRERLAKAMNLNSKLSSSLNTQKSRSRVISSSYRSKVTKRDHISSQGQIMSMDRSNVLKDSKKSKSKLKKQSNMYENINKAAHIYCQKCCNEIKPSCKNSPQWEGSKQLKYSPVLQFKNYEIEGQKILNCNSFELGQMQSLKKLLKNVECQASIDQMKYFEQLQAYTKQQRDLQKVIKENNEKIRNFEESLYKLVDYH